MEGCTETGSICRKVLKPRSDIWSHVALMVNIINQMQNIINLMENIINQIENIINQMQLPEEERVSGEVGGR